MLFPGILKSIVRTGSLSLIDGAGRIHEYGDGAPPRCRIRLGARRLDYTLALNPELSIGEAYMAGLPIVEEGSLFDFLEIAARNYDSFEGLAWLSPRLVPCGASSSAIRSAGPGATSSIIMTCQIASTTSFSIGIVRYCCAYFTSGDDSLEVAQESKNATSRPSVRLDRPRPQDTRHRLRLGRPRSLRG